VGDDAFLVKQILGHSVNSVTNAKLYLTEWIGWQRPTWEEAENLQQHHVDAYEAALARGEKTVNFAPIDEAMPVNPALPSDVFTLSMTEFVSAFADADCNALKAEQAGEPAHGYLHRTAGILAISTACRRTLSMSWMRNSETSTQMAYDLIRLKKYAPRWAARLKGIAIDSACCFLRHVEAKLRTLKPDSPGRVLYEWFANELTVRWHRYATALLSPLPCHIRSAHVVPDALSR
jgi:hypothetical protein